MWVESREKSKRRGGDWISTGDLNVVHSQPRHTQAMMKFFNIIAKSYLIDFHLKECSYTWLFTNKKKVLAPSKKMCECNEQEIYYTYIGQLVFIPELKYYMR